jgi:aryl-alcohol dehydrogenase-like predicted oxidoreductase
MQYRPLGRTGLTVSELGFGGFAIGGNRSGNSYGPTDDATSIAAIGEALNCGCTFFDTADVYGYGHSETLFGQVLGKSSLRHDVVVATKVGGNFDDGTTHVDFSRDHILRAVDASLRRLNRDCIDLYQLHNPDQATIARGEVFAVMEALQAAGKIRHFGVSIHTPAEGRAVIADGRAATIQLPYNLLAVLETLETCDAVIAQAFAAGIGVIIREPLNAGFLSGRHGATSAYGSGDIRSNWTERRRETLAALAEAMRFIERTDVTLAQAALRFTLDEPGVSTTIVGIKTPAQARENFDASDLPPFAHLYEAAMKSRIA